MAARLLCTPTKGKNARGPVISDQQPMLQQLSLDACFNPGAQVTPEKRGAQVTPEKRKRQYKPRGTCGTFQGKRPPKRAHLQDEFQRQRDAHQTELAVKKHAKSQLVQDRAYQQFMKKMLPLETEGSGRDRFRRVAEKWKSQTPSAQDAASVMAAENAAVM